MKNSIPIIFVLALNFLGSGLSAQDLTKAPVIAKNGKWSIRQTTNNMTDKKSCVALYKDRFDIQVTEHSFTFNLRGKGGVKFITLRFDDNQPSSRLPYEIEKDLSIVYIKDDELKQLLQSKRVRIEVLTVLDNIVNEDIDLTELNILYPKISDCKSIELPIPASPPPVITPQPTPEKKEPFDLKSELEKLNKMKKDKLITELEYKDLRKRALEKAKTQ